MRSVHAKAPVGVPVAQAWELLRDLRNCVHWVPGLAKVEITGDRSEGVGASRRVYTERGPGSSGMDETVVDWREGEGFEIRLHDGAQGPPAPFAEGRFRYAVFAEGPQASRIETTMRYAPRWGAVGRLLDALLLRRAMQGMVRRVALGFACTADGRAP